VIRVELFDLARRRAGRALLEVEAATLGEALRRVAETCPDLAALADPGQLRLWRVSLNGERFVEDPGTPLADGDALLVMSAQSGG
jgi:molybdopterin converting factor small subunit